jgi:hypothetical protein
MQGNSLAQIHGARSARLYGDDLDTYQAAKTAIRAEYALDDAADEICLDRLVFHWLKLQAAQEGNAALSTLEFHERRLAFWLGKLGVTRDTRIKNHDDDAAPLIVALLAPFLNRQAAAALPPAEQAPQVVIDVEAQTGNDDARAAGLDTDSTPGP